MFSRLLLLLGDVEPGLLRIADVARDNVGDSALVGLVVTKAADNVDLSDRLGGKRNVEARLTALHLLSGLEDIECVAHLDALAHTTGQIELMAVDFKNVGAPRALLQLRNQGVLNIRDRSANGAIVQRRIVIRFAAEACDFPGFRACISCSARSEKNVAGSRINQANFDLGVRGLHLCSAQESGFARRAATE